MSYTDETRGSRALHNPHAVAERLAIWSEDARRAGRLTRADRLLLAAWEAFDLPTVSSDIKHWAMMTSAEGGSTAPRIGMDRAA